MGRLKEYNDGGYDKIHIKWIAMYSELTGEASGQKEIKSMSFRKHIANDIKTA